MKISALGVRAILVLWCSLMLPLQASAQDAPDYISDLDVQDWPITVTEETMFYAWLIWQPELDVESFWTDTAVWVDGYWYGCFDTPDKASLFEEVEAFISIDVFQPLTTPGTYTIQMQSDYYSVDNPFPCERIRDIYDGDFDGEGFGSELICGGVDEPECPPSDTLVVQNKATVTVNKIFSDDETFDVFIDLQCSSGDVYAYDSTATGGGDPADFIVTGFTEPAVCTATERDGTSGYVADVSDCFERAIAPLEDTECTIVNNTGPVIVTVYKDYTEDHPVADSQVDITLTCPDNLQILGGTHIKITTTSGVGANRKAQFIIEEFPTESEDCVATEAIPAGYEFVSDPGCDALTIVRGGALPACTISNRPIEAVFTVDKNFSDANPNVVADVTVACTDAGGGPGITYSPSASGPAWQDSNFSTTVKYFAGTTSCTASEGDVFGYSQELAQSNCDDGAAITDTVDGSCTIFNQQNSVTIVASKAYGGQGGPAADFEVSCDDATVEPAGGSASPGNPLLSEVSGFPSDGTFCDVTEPVPPSGYYEVDSSCNGLFIEPSDDDTLCTITNAPTIARFRVNKNFIDGNHETPVEVTLSCFTGLPLVQTQIITESQGVNFVVENFDHLQLDCSVTENTQALPGYVPAYKSTGPSAAGNAGGCHFENVGGGEQNTCQIDNYAKPVNVIVEKVWVIEGSGGDFVDTQYTLTLTCDAPISGGAPCDSNAGADAADGLDTADWCIDYTSDVSNKWVARVTPWYPASTCSVTETIYDDSVETDMSRCPEMVIKANKGASCLVTNTVFFEGIPTLSQYSLAILALLMLGMGMVGFRRFA